MIEPLRFAAEKAPPHIIDQAVFCGMCLADRRTRKNPKVASKYCHDCFKNNYLCLGCDAKEHGLMKTKHHVRSLLVVGPPVRKKVLTRGDAKNFPMFLDDVKIKFKARIYDNGKLINSVPVRYFEFLSGQSGDCIHVQVLGCKGLLAADAHGASDPFIAAVYCGVPLGMTRTRHRTVNPKWTNETYVVPCAADLPPPREESFSQKNLLRLEVYDRDYFTSNDFLGHIELSRKKLIDMAQYSNGQPLNLNLTARHHHGTVSVRLGTNGDILYLRVVGGESLEKTDGFGLSDPFCKVFFKGRLVGTTPVCKNTVTPKWTKNNSFAVSLAEVLDEEDRIMAIIKEDEQAAKRGLRRGGVKPLLQSTGGSSRDVRAASTKVENDDDARRQAQIEDLNERSLFVLELYDYNDFNPSQKLGHIRVPAETLRRLVPILPSENDPMPQGSSVNHMIFRAKSATGRFFRGEKSSARVSGKQTWANTPSAKGFNDLTPSEKSSATDQAALDRFNKGSSGKQGMPALSQPEMTATVGDISGVFFEEDEEEESAASPPRMINRGPAPDAIATVGMAALLGQELDGGSSLASDSQSQSQSLQGSSLTSAEPQSHATAASSAHSKASSNASGSAGADANAAPQRQSYRPGAPGEDADPGGSAGEPPLSPSPSTHDDDHSGDGSGFGNANGSVESRGNGNGNSNSDGNNNSSHHDSQSRGDVEGGSSVLSASEKALDAMYGRQMEEDSEDSDEGGGGGGRAGSRQRSRQRNQDGHAEDDLPEEMLEEGEDEDDGSEFDEHVPKDKLRDRGKGTMGEDGVFLEENEALLGRRGGGGSGRRRSSLLQTVGATLGLLSAEDFDNSEEEGSEEVCTATTLLLYYYYYHFNHQFVY
jgi:hypothetical protein